MSSSILKEWKRKKKGQLKENAISKAPEGVLYPLSRSQKRLWFLQQLYPKNPFYNYCEYHEIAGALDFSSLEGSVNRIFEAHEVLRATCHVEEGQIVMRIAPSGKIPITRIDLSKTPASESKKEAEKLMKEDANTAFDLGKGPMYRFTLFQIASDKHIFFLNFHHMVIDEWSMPIFRSQLGMHYANLSEGKDIAMQPSLIQYTDYAYWDNNRKINEDQLNYWTQRLKGEVPVIDLPTDFQRPAQPSFKGKTNKQFLSKELSSNILRLAKEMGVTPFNFLLASFYLFLFKYTAQKDILIGTPISNRGQQSLNNLIGFFINTLVLRTEIERNISFSDLVKKVRKTTLEAFSNKDVPYDVLVKELKRERLLGFNPFFQVMFVYNTTDEHSSYLEKLDIDYTVFGADVSKFDLTLLVSEENGVLATAFEYATDLFQDTTIDRFQEHLKILLEQITEAPDKVIPEFNMMTLGEKETLFPESETKPGAYDGVNGIHEIILQNSKTKGDEPAVAFKQDHITYKELQEKAEKIAQRILHTTNGKKEIVGLCADRSTDMITGLVGILKAGCAYMPIDPDYPEERINFMLADSRANVVVTQENLKTVLGNYDGEQIMLDLEESENEKEINSVDFPLVERTDLAYVIYTSGSTGKPKGVPITHGNIISSTEGRLEFYDQNPKAFLLMSSIAFDSSKAGIFWTLCTGGKLVVAEKHLEQDIEKIGNVIAEQGISHTLMLPSLYGLLLDHSDMAKLQSLSTIMVAGEACLPSVCKNHFEKLPKATLYNEYGPTEGTVWCIAHKIALEDALGNVPIGKGVANSKVFLLDEDLNPVPFGAAGEIYIGGPGLALKYLHNADLTTKVYVESPFEEGEKLYRTGDMGRFNDHGNILFLGRVDQQVKIRGYRIELDEIEKTMDESGLVQRAVAAIEENKGEVSFSDLVNDPSKLWAHLESNMSEHEIYDLLSYVEAMEEEEKNYLLNQIQ